MCPTGAWGIIEAQTANPCGAVNATLAGCEPVRLINLPGMGQTSFETTLVWTHWLGE